MIVDIKPNKTILIKVYMPTREEEIDGAETIYEELYKIIENTKGEENLIVLGDWNATVGEEKKSGVVVRYGFANRN